MLKSPGRHTVSARRSVSFLPSNDNATTFQAYVDDVCQPDHGRSACTELRRINRGVRNHGTKQRYTACAHELKFDNLDRP
jgi:hypothetical protein